MLFGEFSFEDGKVRRLTGARESIFAELVLAPLFAALGADGEEAVDAALTSPLLAAALAEGSHPSKKSSSSGEKNGRLKASSLSEAAKDALRRALPVARTVLRAVVEKVPSPETAQAAKCAALFPGGGGLACCRVEAVQRCDASGATLAYVSKISLFEDGGENSLFAVARVFAGAANVGDELCVLLEHGDDDSAAARGGGLAGSPLVTHSRVTLRTLHAMMGSSLLPVSSARAGQLVAFGPEVVRAMGTAKRATLVSVPADTAAEDDTLARLSIPPPDAAQTPLVRVVVFQDTLLTHTKGPPASCFVEKSGASSCV